MNILIIEDEIPAAEKLSRYLLKYDPQINIMATLTSVSSSAEWLSYEDNKPNVIFMDIQLTDGLSFEIFGLTNISCPIIFTTAHDDYALDAFKVNSIDYILKPITYTEVSNALKKLDTLTKQLVRINSVPGLIQSLQSRQKKDRFLVKKGNHIQSIKTTDIQLFYAEGRTVFLVTLSNDRYIIDYNLSDLEEILESKLFCRINRSYIININSIKKINKHSNSRMKLVTSFVPSDDIIVSRERVTNFKMWLEGNG